METIRSFLAVRINIDVVQALAEVQKRLRDFCDDSQIRVAWVPPPNMHVTIRFLGQVTEPMVYAIQDMVKPTLSRHPEIDLGVAGLGVFPDLETPRIIWAGLTDGADQMASLYGAVSDRLVDAGFNLEDRPFKAHVTIGRIKSGDPVALGPCLEELGAPWGTTRVRNLYCYRSDLKSKGAEHHAVWRLPLTGRAPRVRDIPKTVSDSRSDDEESDDR
jgi:2'-5' RNA ligase